MDKSTNLVWIDIEGTAADVSVSHIIEIALIITDSNLVPLNSGLDFVIHRPKSVMARMDQWNVDHHGLSGLTAEVAKSKHTLAAVEKILLAEIEKYCNPKTAPLCGNSVFYDKYLLGQEMPRIYNYLHYRVIDTSSIKELFYRWYKHIPPMVKSEHHRALEDIEESIAELKYYREHIFQ